VRVLTYGWSDERELRLIGSDEPGSAGLCPPRRRQPIGRQKRPHRPSSSREPPARSWLLSSSARSVGSSGDGLLKASFQTPSTDRKTLVTRSVIASPPCALTASADTRTTPAAIERRLAKIPVFEGVEGTQQNVVLALIALNDGPWPLLRSLLAGASVRRRPFRAQIALTRQREGGTCGFQNPVAGHATTTG